MLTNAQATTKQDKVMRAVPKSTLLTSPHQKIVKNAKEHPHTTTTPKKAQAIRKTTVLIL